MPLARDPLYGRRIVICDYHALLMSVTGLLRMSGYCVFQAYDAQAARELCRELPNIELLILNTTGTGTDTPTLVREIRGQHPDLPVLHIGTSTLAGMPDDVPTLAESDGRRSCDVGIVRFEPAVWIDGMRPALGMQAKLMRLAIGHLLVEQAVDGKVVFDVVPIDPVETPRQ